MYTQKMHQSLRRDLKGKHTVVTDLLDEIERLQNICIDFTIDYKRNPSKEDIEWAESVCAESADNTLD